MAHFQSAGRLQGSPTWTPTEGYAPVKQLSDKPQVSVSYIEATHQLPRKESFRPLPHKTLPLLCLAAIVLALIGALEYSLHVLPHASFDVPALATNSTVSKREAAGRDVAVSTTATAAAMAPTAASATSITPISPSSDFFQAGATTVNGPISTSDAFFNAEGTTVTSVQKPTAGAPGAVIGTSGAVVGAPGAIVGTAGAGAGTPAAGVGTPAAVAGSPGVSGPLGTAAGPTGAATESGGSTAVPSGGTTVDMPPGGKKKEPVFQSDVPLTLVKDSFNYFLSIYAAVIVSVIIRLLLGYLFRSTKLVDPFFMLSSEEGSPFPLWEDHLGCETVFAPWYAIRCRRWLLLWTSVAYAAAQLLTPFASELTAIHLSKYDLPNGYVRGHSIWVNSLVARLLEALLGIIFVLIVVTWAMLRRTNSGVRTSPASIATIASLVGHPATARDLSIDQWADKQTTARLFEARRYRLESYVLDGVECYGIVPVGDVPPSMHVEGDLHTPKSRSVALKDSVNLLLITASAAVLFGLILTYLETFTLTPLERFMGSQTFGPRFLLSALGLALKSPLLALSARTVASVPFSRLAARPRRQADIVTPVPITPQGAIGYALKRRAWFAGGIAVVSGVIIEVLLILLPGVPFNAQLSWNASKASWFGSLTCLGLILAVAIVGWIRMFAKSNDWPKSPTTVGAVAMYVAGTSMSMDRAADRETASMRRVYHEFGMRSGRWVVDYSSKGFGGRATPVFDTQSEQPTLPSPAPQAPPQGTYIRAPPPFPDPSVYRDNDSPRRASGYEPYTYPTSPKHVRAVSHGGNPTPYPSAAPTARSERNSVSGTGYYPGRPEYGGGPTEIWQVRGRDDDWQ